MPELTDSDRAAITAAVLHSAAYRSDPPMTEEQTGDAVALATDLYAAAAAHGLERADVDGVTSFTSAAVDGIRWRDRARAQARSGRRTDASAALCALCGLPADALVHHATANGHAYSREG